MSLQFQIPNILQDSKNISCYNLLFPKQAGASRLGYTINAMDKGSTCIEEYTLLSTGSNLGISPSSVNFSGLPFSNVVLLFRSLSSGVKWYSSLNVTSDSFVPTQENAFLSWLMNELSMWVLLFASSFSPLLTCTLSWTLSMNLVWLLKLISSNVTPSCRVKEIKNGYRNAPMCWAKIQFANCQKLLCTYM